MNHLLLSLHSGGQARGFAERIIACLTATVHGPREKI
jgi:hypothetical protein